MYKFSNFIRYIIAPENCTSLMSYVCFYLGILCVPVSAFFMLHNFPEDMTNRNFDNQILSIFIGLWAINLVGIANFLKKR